MNLNFAANIGPTLEIDKTSQTLSKQSKLWRRREEEEGKELRGPVISGSGGRRRS